MLMGVASAGWQLKRASSYWTERETRHRVEMALDVIRVQAPDLYHEIRQAAGEE